MFIHSFINLFKELFPECFRPVLRMYTWKGKSPGLQAAHGLVGGTGKH